jgi:hypothetical protein
MIPMPPIHWVNDLQKRIPWGRTPGSGMIEAPVVVKPDAVSKTASVTLLIVPVNRYGSAPRRPIAIHAMPTAANPSLVLSSPGRSNSFHTTAPVRVVTAAAPAI